MIHLVVTARVVWWPQFSTRGGLNARRYVMTLI